MDNICERCYHNYVCDEYNADRDFPHKVCAYHNSHFIDAADVVEVRHAKWKYFHKQNKAVCTSCSFERDLDADFGRAIACPNCAARMGKEDEHGS